MVLAPFRSQMHVLGVKLDPFRTLKVQWGHPVFSAAGVGSRNASHTHYRLIFVLKTAQDARHFFGLAFVGPFSFPNSVFSSQLHPFRTLKVQWGTLVFLRRRVGSRSVRYR